MTGHTIFAPTPPNPPISGQCTPLRSLPCTPEGREKERQKRIPGRSDHFRWLTSRAKLRLNLDSGARWSPRHQSWVCLARGKLVVAVVRIAITSGNAKSRITAIYSPAVYHPWFSYRTSLHQPPPSKDDHYRSLFLQASSPSADHIAAFEKLFPSLPDPVPLADVLSELRSNLEAFPQAMLGEVGLDRVFRVPFDYYAEQRRLTPFVVPFDHQLAILEAQLDLAAELGRNVSFHSVKSQLVTQDLLARMQAKHKDKWSRISIDLHSCGVSPETWRDIEA
ncbi:hypothetical protein D9615_001222 [Tricholomella constricta]|uniref:Uncharacterized protein n=1 Tax=Tricholomella constricta TaxID=117010 RepID=A0A8H5HL72_9AGAR|nr:hypothetical protein D9615_001222 [Tricholomella constricta]